MSTAYFTHLESSANQTTYAIDKLWNLCPKTGKPLLARYDLDLIRKNVTREQIAKRPPTMWRYREVLPVIDDSFVISLGEGWTPLIETERLRRHLDFKGLFIKEEGVNPTTSFKARGLSMAVSKAKELGVKAVSIPSAGNAAGAMSAYAAVAELESHVFMPKDVPEPFIAECRALGAKVTLVDGLITDCGKLAAKELAEYGRFDLSTLKEPYRLEGKKTMGYEVAEQFGWTLPDVIIYPTGGGTGLIGMWKAFDEMEALGWIDSFRPRMVSVQAAGCAPMVRAFQNGDKFATPWENAHTKADGLRVPAAVGDFLILNAVRESNGSAVAVSDNEMIDAANLIGKTEGLFVSPEGGATLAAFNKLRSDGWIKESDRVVLFNTGSGHKYFGAFSQ
ncbi:MAG: threonine synthase [Calditrichia bacterium]